MRYASLLFIAFIVPLLSGCRANPLFLPGDDLSGAADLAGVDLKQQGDMKPHHDMAMPPPDFSDVDLAGRMCFTGTCTQPNCGTNCCGAGEWCDNGTCRCGTNNGCTDKKMCASAGPVPLSQCGSICCGAGTPCPL